MSAPGTRFTDLVGCRLPLQQAGMGGVATPELALAVSGAGGLGMLATPMLPPAALAELAADVASRAAGPVGVNFLMPFLDPACVEVAAARLRVVEFFYGDPEPGLVQRVHDQGALAAWQVGSVGEARAAEDAGCDFVVAQGTEAGGHVRGRLGLLPLLDGVLASVAVPVVAAGGIATGRAMAAAMAAGADAVRIGTALLATHESGAHPRYVAALLDATGEDTVLTETFSVMWPDAPHRVLRSCVAAAEAFTGDTTGTMVVGDATMPVPRFAPPCPDRHTTGSIEAMALYAGESVGAVREVRPAADVVTDICAEAARLLAAR